MGTASTTAMTSVVTDRTRVGSSRCRISRLTGSWEKMEMPSSPWRICPTQATNWTGSGRSSPSCFPMRAMSSAVAKSPAIRVAGSPGARWSSRKTITATTPMTGMVARIRRTR